MKKIYVYIHLPVMGKYQEAVSYLLSRIYDSGLYSAITKLKLSVVGNYAEFESWFNIQPYDVSKVELINQSVGIETCEFFTLHQIYADAKSEDFYCLYLHPKGITRPDNVNIQDWLECMLYFNIDSYRACLNELSEFDAVGINLQGNPEDLKEDPLTWGYGKAPLHFSGGFWWAKSEYINKTLPDPLSLAPNGQYKKYRMCCEMWLCMNENINPKCLHQSGVDHYHNRYPIEKYLPKPAGGLNIYTRSADDQLYMMMQMGFNLAVNEFYQCKQFPGNIGSISYLYYIISESKEDWIVSCDEDCFVTNEDSIIELIEFMKANDYDYCGMPDGGICKHRNNSWTNVNPFFIIFNVKKIREVLAVTDREEINKIKYDESKVRSDHLILGELRHSEVIHSSQEVFSGFLYWLAYNFRGVYLNAQDHADGTSTILLDLHGKPFAKHAWYSRGFSKEPHHTRILNLYNEARGQS